MDDKLEQQAPLGYAKDIKMAFCSFVCYLKVAIIIFGSSGVFLINGNYKTYAKQEIDDDEFLTIIGVVGSIGNGCTRYGFPFMQIFLEFVVQCNGLSNSHFVESVHQYCCSVCHQIHRRNSRTLSLHGFLDEFLHWGIPSYDTNICSDCLWTSHWL